MARTVLQGDIKQTVIKDRPAPAKKSTPQPVTRELEITQSGGRYGESRVVRLTVPGRCTITYSPVNMRTGEGHEGCVLRVYDGKNQTALFREVTAFRDTAYPMKVQVVTKHRKGESYVDSKGNREVAESDTVTRHWESSEVVEAMPADPADPGDDYRL